MFTVYDKKTNEEVKVYATENDNYGKISFLIYHNNKWVWADDDSFTPEIPKPCEHLWSTGRRWGKSEYIIECEKCGEINYGKED